MEALTVKGYGRDAKSIPVLDSKGKPIHEGDYVQLIKDTTWHKEGEILLVTGASYSDGIEQNVYVSSAHNSSTAVHASMVRVVTSKKVEKDFKLALMRNQLANVESVISSAYIKRAGILETLRQLGDNV